MSLFPHGVRSHITPYVESLHARANAERKRAINRDRRSQAQPRASAHHPPGLIVTPALFMLALKVGSTFDLRWSNPACARARSPCTAAKVWRCTTVGA